MKKQDFLPKGHGISIGAKELFLVCALILIYCPFFYTDMIGNYVGDAAIQIKIGLDCLSSGRFIPVEIYSWHEGLNWWPHETGWYYIVGVAYKLFGLFGVIGVWQPASPDFCHSRITMQGRICSRNSHSFW